MSIDKTTLQNKGDCGLLKLNKYSNFWYKKYNFFLYKSTALYFFSILVVKSERHRVKRGKPGVEKLYHEIKS